MSNAMHHSDYRINVVVNNGAAMVQVIDSNGDIIGEGVDLYDHEVPGWIAEWLSSENDEDEPS